ncbi:hypothetical protein AA0481_0227 [Acetobacter orientalis NRIC 0481]|nr:hypothetical protein AA0481_0227 [Acetobacter orientalis NRIC 0481]
MRFAAGIIAYKAHAQFTGQAGYNHNAVPQCQPLLPVKAGGKGRKQACQQ